MDNMDLFGGSSGDDFSGSSDSAEIGFYTENAYLSYAVSVVKGRAIPSVQDGQKPVQRRILYAMHEMGLTAGSKHVKSARVVGDVLGKFHPHGDSSAYEAAVRMAQDFTLRYPLIDGQGNFGSRDGDGAAAMRYTEMRLSPISELLLSEIDRGTVDFQPNYDGAFEEPVLMPARLPMMLLNGATGIAVGLACDVLPHNLREVGAATLAVMEGQDPLEHISGPDFPGGGQVINAAEEIRQAYTTGRGSIRMRARWTVEQLARGQWRVIIHELPHEVSAEAIVEEIDAISNPKPKKNKKTLDQDQLQLKQSLVNLIDTVKNESKKQIRLVIEPRTSKVDPDEMMNFLLANTNLERNYKVNMTMIGLDGRPQLLGIRAILEQWVSFRKETVRRRCVFDLDKIEKRIHILEGRMIAFLHIDEVIRVIRESDEPKAALIENFSLTEIQAEDILEIRLRQLARLEGIKIENELNGLRKDADRLRDILGSEVKLKNQVKREIEADIEKYGDDRRTLIEPVERVAASTKAFITDEPVTILLSKNGWIRSRGGHGVDRATLSWKQGDSEFAVLETRTTHSIVLMDNNGRAYSIAASDVPGGKGDGVPVTSLIELQASGRIVHALSAGDEDKFLFASDSGYGFIAPFKNLIARPRAGKAFMTVEKGEVIHAPLKLNGESHIAAIGNDRLLVFPIEEMKELANGGKGVIIMDVADKKLDKIMLSDGLQVPVVGRRGKEKVLQGDELQKHILHRARKGCQLP